MMNREELTLVLNLLENERQAATLERRYEWAFCIKSLGEKLTKNFAVLEVLEPEVIG
jgi:hypothetical protein